MLYDEVERMVSGIAERQVANQVAIDKLTEAVAALGKSVTTLE